MKQYFEIVDVMGREILDSRGNPTVEVEVTLDDGALLEEQPFLPVLPPVCTKPVSCVTVTRAVTLARA